MYDFNQLHIDVQVLFYADGILICLLAYKRSQEEDLRALFYILNVFGYFSGLKVYYEKTFVVVKTRRDGGG